jgi:predicted transcriptional regulator YheO
MSKLSDKAWLMREASRITAALGETFAPLCEVVLHDLTMPEHSIVQIENNLSGRSVGDSATEIGLARIADCGFPDVIANYANKFTDGRAVKCTSIGLKDKAGKYVAAICLNVDISYLKSVSAYLNELTRIKSEHAAVEENLASRSKDVATRILGFAASRNRDPRALTSEEKSEILQQLAAAGELERRGAAGKIAALLGLSRSNIYYYLKKSRTANVGPRLQPSLKSSLPKARRRRPPRKPG